MEILQKAVSLNLLLVGNNPIELGGILEKLKEANGPIRSEIAFDFRSLFDRLTKFTPDYIVIDDNIGRQELTLILHELNENKKTSHLPVTVLKNSNYEEANGSPSVLDYLLKQNFSAESLLTSVRNSLKFRRAQSFLYKAYQNRKRYLEGLVQS